VDFRYAGPNLLDLRILKEENEDEHRMKRKGGKEEQEKMENKEGEEGGK
jgi:hypothetical protein